MNPAFSLALMVMASISVARADEVNTTSVPSTGHTRQSETTAGCEQDCAHYGQNCRFRTCCQYPGRSRISCFRGTCVQGWCASIGRPCVAAGYAECCYDLGLYCLDGNCTSYSS